MCADSMRVQLLHIRVPSVPSVQRRGEQNYASMQAKKKQKKTRLQHLIHPKEEVILSMSVQTSIQKKKRKKKGYSCCIFTSHLSKRGISTNQQTHKQTKKAQLLHICVLSNHDRRKHKKPNKITHTKR